MSETDRKTGDKPGEPALVTALFSRRLAEPVARLCVRLGISANAVTVAGGACWMASLPLALLAGVATSEGGPTGSWLWLLCAFLWCAGYFLDVVDGSVARMTGTGSTAGFFLDYVFHVLFKPAFLFSVGLGLLPPLFGSSPLNGWALIVLFFSVPANGSQASHAAELALRADCAAGRLRPGEGPAARWLGSDAVVAPASEKRGSPLRVAATLAREVASYYLQAPLFAAAVAVDAVRLLLFPADGPPSPCGPFGPMPCTTFLWLALGTLFALRIELRCIREGRRLGTAEWRRAGRGFFLRLAWEPVLMAAMVLVLPDFAMPCSCEMPVFQAWGDWLVAFSVPFLPVLCAPAEEVAAAHVFCQTAGRGGSPDPAGAPWRPPLAAVATGVVLFFVGLAEICPLFFGPETAYAASRALLFVALNYAIPVLVLLQFALLPVRVRRVYRRLARG